MMIQLSIDYIISMIIFILFFIIYNELQIQFLIWSLKSFINEITIYDIMSVQKIYQLIETYSKSGYTLEQDKERLKRIINQAIESFVIMPVNLDPSLILKRLEHILDVRKKHLSNLAKRILPDAPEAIQKNLQSALEAAGAIRTLWKLSTHIYRVGHKTKNLIYLFQLKLLVPLLRELCISYFDALKGFTLGVPIGDSVGPLVAQRFFGEEVEHNEKYDVAFSSTEIDGRYILAIKAKGPGSEVGYPGRFLEALLQRIGGNIDAIITVDAALRLESENSGDINVGFGAAIGDPGPEKFRIEKWSAEYNIPLYAVVIKENYIEALTPLNKALADAVDKAYNIIRELILDNIPEGGKVIILGIGNTIGVGNESNRFNQQPQKTETPI